MDLAQQIPLVILSGNSHPEFTKSVCMRLNISPTECIVFNSTSKETQVEIARTVRARDVFIIQTGTKNVNNDIIEFLIIAYACKTSSAKNIIGVFPYLPYCKQSKMRKRGSIVSRLLADMMKRGGITRLITMDLHKQEIIGFYSFPVDNLRACPAYIEYITHTIPNYKESVIVARNPNAVKRASSYAERLGLSMVVIHGEVKLAEQDTEDGRTSPPLPDFDQVLNRITRIDIENIPVLSKKEKPPMYVVGDVKDRVAIIVDDIIDEVGPYISAAELLHEVGAERIYVIVTHALLLPSAAPLLQESYIDELIVTNTVPLDIQPSSCNKIRTVDVSEIFAEAIRRIHNRESMSSLYRTVDSSD